MRYLTLATDYDGTLATDGAVGDEVLSALERLRKSGRKLMLVTGRELPELKTVFPRYEIFDWIVAENGALVYRPSDHCQKLLAAAPPEALIDAIRRKGIERFSVGAAILATWRPHETALLEAIRDQGLEYHVIFNKDAVMALPAGVTKASGLKAVLKETGLSAHNVVGVGDAENDHAFLNLCEMSVAVANAIEPLKQRVDWVTPTDHGAGVVQLIDVLLKDDLAGFADRLGRHRVLLGTSDDGSAVNVKPYGENLLIAGSSGSGKSTLATGFVERLVSQGYRVCVIDPEGDYGALAETVTIGSAQQPPLIDEAIRLFERAGPGVVLNLVGVHLADRPSFFVTLLSRLHELRAANGQPHWIVIDEAQHVLPASWEPAWPNLPERLDRVALVTLEPDSITPQLLPSVDTVIAVGDKADATLKQFAALRRLPVPAAVDGAPPGGAILWRVSTGEPPRVIDIAPSSAAHQRHVRKYAEGDLGSDRSFYFRGPQDKLNLRAQNLMLFAQMAEGVDDDTWLYHLRQHDYSNWFREQVKDSQLADEARQIEDAPHPDAHETRLQLLALITERYTAPATGVVKATR
ncbi:MAG TPA: HAD-IIB family hydrolase [Pirellulales bacterium]|nr:HAD-IIB family hydrolase [Pirellulales bacterium]